MSQAKKKSPKKAPVKKDAADLKRNQTFQLTLTLNELLHVRDIRSVILPPSSDTRLSEALAQHEGRELSEGNLWQKVCDLCVEANVPTGTEAPDFYIGIQEPVSFGVFQLDGEEGDE